MDGHYLVLLGVLGSCASSPDIIKEHMREARYTEAILEAEEYLANRDEEHRFEVLVLMDVASFREAERVGTAAAYLAYIRRFPRGSNLGAAKTKRARLLFDEIRNERESVDAYQEFLAEFPKGHLPSMARERILELSWLEAEKQQRHSAVRKFRKKFPGSKYEKEAYLLEAELFSSTLAQPTSKQLRAFADRYAESPLSEKALDEAEELDWTAADAAQTVEAWVRYLRDNPNGRRRDDARARLESFSWMDRIAGEVAGSHDLAEMVVTCDRSGTSVINPWTEDKVTMSHRPVSSCAYSPKGQFLASSIIEREARDGIPAQIALHVQDLTTNDAPVRISTASTKALCLVGTLRYRCNTKNGVFGRRGHARTPDGRMIPMVGVWLDDGDIIELEVNDENWLRKEDFRSIRFENLDLVSSLLARIDYSTEPGIPIRRIGQVELTNRNPDFDEHSFMSPATVVGLPGGRAAVNIAEGCYQSDYALFDPKTRHLISLTNPKIRSRTFTKDIEVTSYLTVSKHGNGYIVFGCWHDFEGTKKLCKPYPADFLGPSASISLF